jgi:hypothetical protein
MSKEKPTHLKYSNEFDFQEFKTWAVWQIMSAISKGRSLDSEMHQIMSCLLGNEVFGVASKVDNSEISLQNVRVIKKLPPEERMFFAQNLGLSKNATATTIVKALKLKIARQQELKLLS